MSINPDDIKNNPEQIKQMISLLSSMLEDTNTEPKTKRRSTKKKTAKRKTVKESTTTTRKSRKKPTTTNKFDQMSESSMFKENPDTAKKLYSKPPMTRRPKKNLVNVKCRICGKEEKISASLLTSGIDRYKCNKCSSSAG